MALRNDCFALPAGVEWTPVDEALGLLRERMEPVTEIERVQLNDASGRILAKDIAAQSSTPPADNSAVDGYALAADGLSPEGEQSLMLLEGRAAAGSPFDRTVPPSSAVRILTGAVMPEGTDSVVMDEDVDIVGKTIRFGSGLRHGANRRKAGEDIAAGEIALKAGLKLGAADLAQAASVGVGMLSVRKRLRVAVLSTGDELRAPSDPLKAGQIYDANKPMLASMLRTLGFEVVDLGIIQDDPALLQDALQRGATEADAIVTSGGASAGDEDHLSRMLGELGTRHLWRIAVKPGRPMALGQIERVPVFGLPGNPVAAYVCFIYFARLALLRMAGADWSEPAGYPLISAFHAKKKPGRTELLRGRVNADGQVEKFGSDGSGLISGLRWSDGLIKLDHARGPVEPGETVSFIPYSAFGT